MYVCIANQSLDGIQRQTNAQIVNIVIPVLNFATQLAQQGRHSGVLARHGGNDQSDILEASSTRLGHFSARILKKKRTAGNLRSKAAVQKRPDDKQQETLHTAVI